MRRAAQAASGGGGGSSGTAGRADGDDGTSLAFRAPLPVACCPKPPAAQRPGALALWLRLGAR